VIRVADDLWRILIEEIARVRPDASGVDSGSLLGAGGLEMDSLTIAELAVSLEVALEADLIGMELDRVKAMTVEQFAEHIRVYLSAGEAG
jgi:hypothetical protein